MNEQQLRMFIKFHEGRQQWRLAAGFKEDLVILQNEGLQAARDNAWKRHRKVIEGL